MSEQACMFCDAGIQHGWCDDGVTFNGEVAQPPVQLDDLIRQHPSSPSVDVEPQVVPEMVALFSRPSQIPGGTRTPDERLAQKRAKGIDTRSEERAVDSRRNGDPRFHALLRQVADLHDQKQADYGRDQDPFANVRASEEWGVTPWIGALIRATDKVRRLQTYASKGSLINEGVEDSLMDLAVYALISLILFREAQE